METRKEQIKLKCKDLKNSDKVQVVQKFKNYTESNYSKNLLVLQYRYVCILFFSQNENPIPNRDFNSKKIFLGFSKM